MAANRTKLCEIVNLFVNLTFSIDESAASDTTSSSFHLNWL
jgi:hypothetical protein